MQLCKSYLRLVGLPGRVRQFLSFESCVFYDQINNLNKSNTVSKFNCCRLLSLLWFCIFIASDLFYMLCILLKVKMGLKSEHWPLNKIINIRFYVLCTVFVETSLSARAQWSGIDSLLVISWKKQNRKFIASRRREPSIGEPGIWRWWVFFQQSGMQVPLVI